MLQIFLGNHPNSGVILNYAWHSTTLNLKGVVMHAMGEWYRNSQVSLIYWLWCSGNLREVTQKR